MEYKINLTELEKYAAAFAEKACVGFFASNSVITGNQIIKLTPSEQVNFFILQDIFEKWKEETARLRSPYFDYEQPEVKEALKNFINKLSNFIAVKQGSFTPLVQKACYNTVWFSFLPEDFISKNFLNKPLIAKEELKEKGRYIKFHKAFYTQFLIALDHESKEEISSVELSRILGQVYQTQKHLLDNTDVIVSQLSSVLYFDADKILIKPVIKHETIKPIEPVKPVEVKQETITVDMKQEIPKQQQPVTIEIPKKEEIHETLNAQFSKSQSTLNDLFRGKTPDPAAVAKGKISSIRAAISINKKYLFVNSLFKGNSENFDKAITELDNAPDEQTAKDLAHNYATQLGWEKSKEEMKELLELLTRKFL